MSNKFRKIIAASTALLITASLCGCADSGYIGSVNGLQIPTGIYLYDVAFTAYNEATTKIKEARGDDSSTAEVKVFTETIDGKPASAWLKDTAVERLKRYAAIESLFTEYGLSLSSDDTTSINDYINTLDDDLGYYAQYYGIEESSFGEHYANMGIGKSSLRSLSENSYKEKYVFLHNYDKDGLTPVGEDEINKYADENYAVVKYLKVDLTDYAGLELKEDSDKNAVKVLAQSWADRYNAGEDWTQIQYEYDLRQAWNNAWADAENKYAEEKSSTAEASTQETAPEPESAPDAATTEASTAETAPQTAEAGSAEAETEAPAEETAPTAPEKPVVNTDDAEYNAYCQKAIDEVTVEKNESADDSDKFVSKENSSLSETLTEYVWNAAADSKATIFEDTENNCVYVVVRDDITTKTTWLESQNESFLHALRDDAFDEMLKGIYADYSVDLDDYLVNTKYAPEKLKGIGE